MTKQEKPRRWLGPVPPCDFCGDHSRITDNFFDAATKHGPWAIMCGFHYRTMGLPMGQWYQQRDGEWFKLCNLNSQPDHLTLDDENLDMKHPGSLDKPAIERKS